MLTLALGVQWIAHRKAIVKELRSVKALGSVVSVGYMSRQDGYFDDERTNDRRGVLHR